jgi:glyoxylase-like metal-dependent hydrolase (beta-lactamase superfamily II)
MRHNTAQHPDPVSHYATPLLLGVLSLAIAAQPIAAQTSGAVRTADPARRGLQLTDFPRVIKLAENVYGYEEIRSPGFTTVSLFVVGTNGVLLADGQGNARATATMLEKIREVTDKPLKWYVVGSDHGDHTGGNSALPAGLKWVVHPTSRSIMRLDSIPHITGDRESIDLGGITVDVLSLGRAHTGGDLMVHLPREKILFMSEAFLNRVFPAMRSAFPSEWLAMVDRALAMDVERFVPGHGFIEEPAASREELAAFRKSLDVVIGEVKRLHALGISADSAISVANWGEYSDWFIAGQQAPIAVRRIYDEIAGRLPPPPRD